eukprot:1804725-Amphidinium_carterae.1
MEKQKWETAVFEENSFTLAVLFFFPTDTNEVRMSETLEVTSSLRAEGKVTTSMTSDASAGAFD